MYSEDKGRLIGCSVCITVYLNVLCEETDQERFRSLRSKVTNIATVGLGKHQPPKAFDLLIEP